MDGVTVLVDQSFEQLFLVLYLLSLRIAEKYLIITTVVPKSDCLADIIRRPDQTIQGIINIYGSKSFGQ